MDLELSPSAETAILRECLRKIKFNSTISVTTKLTILVDDLTEYEYDFQHTLDKQKEKALWSTVVDNSTQTDHVQEDIDSQAENETYAKHLNGNEGCVQIKVEKYLASDGDNDHYDDENDPDPISLEAEDLHPTADAPNTFLESLDLAKQHDLSTTTSVNVKLESDVQEPTYYCPICQKCCRSTFSLAEHVRKAHCNNDTGTRIGKRKSLRPKKRPGIASEDSKYFVDDSETDDDYMENENVKTVQKSKKMLLPKTSKKKEAKKHGKSHTKAKKKVKKVDKDKITGDDEAEDALFTDVKVAVAKVERNIFDKTFKSALGHVRCAQCGKEYKSKRALRRHFSTSHEKTDIVCEICGHSFKGKESLYHHKRGVHENLKVYKCDEPGCDMSFNFSHSLRLHRLKHTGARPHMCSTCGKTYLTAYHLKVHIQATHLEKKNFSCKLCNKPFSYSTSLKMHMATHNKTERVKCESCEKTFVNHQAMKYHVMSKHTEPGHYPCDECSKVCKTELLLKSHKRRHATDSSRFMCDICGRQFMYKSALEMHRAVHRDDKSFTCKTCGKSFKTYPTLYSHQYVHKEDSPHTCDSCGKSFKTKERLKAHERRHTGLKPFKCMICQHSFPDKGGLSKHMRTVHCKVKKFVCDICGKATSRADNLRVHMKVHAKGTDYKPPKAREMKQVKSVQSAPDMVPLSYDIAKRAGNCTDLLDQNSHDSQSNASNQYEPNCYEPNVPNFSTMGVSNIGQVQSDQNMPLNLHNAQPGRSSQQFNITSGSESHTNQPSNYVNVANPTLAHANPPTTASSSNMISIPGVQPPYMYTWPYVYQPGLQPPSGNSPGFFQQQ